MIHLSLHVSAFTKADESPVADDDMVEDGDFHDLAGIGNALGDDDVLVARFRVPRRVVVDQDDRRRIVAQSITENLPRLCQCVTTLICNKRKRKIKIRTKLRK